MKIANSNDSAMDSIAQVLEEMKASQGNDFSYANINLAELERLTGLSRQRLRTLKKNNFKKVPHGNSGKTNTSVLDGYTGTLDNLLKSGIDNSSVCYDRIKSQGYPGSQSTVKRYIQKHRDLIPAKRQLIAPQGSRGMRYTSGPGESYQMDWSFSKVISHDESEYTVVCFAMICHHCGMRYVEFFPNAKQENLFIDNISNFLMKYQICH